MGIPMQYRGLESQQVIAHAANHLQEIRCYRSVGFLHFLLRNPELPGGQLATIQFGGIPQYGLRSVLVDIVANSLNDLLGRQGLTKNTDGQFSAPWTDNVTVRRKFVPQRIDKTSYVVLLPIEFRYGQQSRNDPGPFVLEI